MTPAEYEERLKSMDERQFTEFKKVFGGDMDRKGYVRAVLVGLRVKIRLSGAGGISRALDSLGSFFGPAVLGCLIGVPFRALFGVGRLA